MAVTAPVAKTRRRRWPFMLPAIVYVLVVIVIGTEVAGLFVDDGGHFSVRGNEIVARWLAKEIAPLK